MNISKAFGLFRKFYIGVYGPEIEILVSEFTTFESVRISISGPKTIEITKVNWLKLTHHEMYQKKLPILGIN